MKCLRCGNKAPKEQLFCDDCLADMEKHPVKPGTPIHIPKRNENIVIKRGNFRLAISKWQDQIFRLKYTIFWLIVVIVLLLAVLTVGICMMLQLTPEWFNNIVYKIPPIERIMETSIT
jgi:hypothetical protein